MKLEADGISLNISARGRNNLEVNRPSLIFLHYFGGSARSWTEVIDRLAAEYHCLAPDLRGFGTSDAPTNGYALNDYADDIAALIEAANIESYVLVGHSMGGKIALTLAVRQPAKLRSLVLLATSPPTPEPIPEDERARLLTAHGSRTAAEETLRKITAHPVPEPVFERCIEDALRCSLPAWRAWLEHGSREDISADVTRINVPTLIVAGEMDEPLTAELLQREVVRRINGARITTLPGVRHLLPLENPAALVALIRIHMATAT